MVKKRKSRLPAGIKHLTDGRYQIRATFVDPVTRKRKDRMQILAQESTLTQAFEALEALRESLMVGVEEVNPEASLPTLAACSQSWLARKAARNLAKTTLESYAYNLAHCLELVDDQLPLDEYSREHLIALRTQLEGIKKYSAVTIRDWWKSWTTMVRDNCLDRGLMDPTWKLEGPAVSSKPKRELRTLSRQQVHQMVECVTSTSNGSDYPVLVAVLAYTGMRLGEGLALEWSKVHFDRRIIEIARSVTWTRQSGWQLKSPKNGKVRKVAIAEPLLEVLKAHKQGQRASGRLPVGLVCRSKEGRYLQSTSTRRRLRAASETLELGLVVTPQVLRRTWNTLASECIDRVLIQAQMGHADDSMTSHYLGVRDETLRQSVDEMWELRVGLGAK